MEKHDKEDDFAKKYWETFEKLVLSLVEKNFENSKFYNFHVYKTPSQKDGGYDGVIIFEPTTNPIVNLKELYTILTEAKLRKNANKDLPLSDFAKTLIIAINRNAMEVYIFSNLHYSSETQQRVGQFSAATSLKVKLIDLFEICDDLDKFPEIKAEFPEEFIDSLFEALPLHDTEKRIRYVKENIFTTELPELVGDYRNSLRDKYVGYLKQQTGVFIISGIQGAGKSLLIKHIINELQYEFNCNIVQLEKFSTIKEFFIYMLSLIWNVDTINIYSLTEEDFDEIALYLPEQHMAKRIKAILLNILGETSTEYENRQDVFEAHLIEYLYYIFSPICRRKKQLFAFTNLEKCGDNILNFANKFIRKFSSENIIILAEIRTDIPRLKTYIDEWALLNSETEPIKLCEFNRLEYNQYMQKAYPEMDLTAIENLYTICFPLPLYIDNLISFIDNNDLEHILSKNELNIKKLYKNEKFIENCIQYSLKNYFQSQNRSCKKLAYIVGFFDGEIALNNIKELGADFQMAAAALADSIYFDIERNILQIHHMLYLKALQKESIVNDYENNEILYLLNSAIDRMHMDTSIKELKKFEIAIAICEEDYVSGHWEKLCNKLINQNDFSLSKRFLENILEKEILPNKSRLCLINKIIECYLGLNEYKSQNLLGYIGLGTQALQNCSIHEDKILFYYLKSKYFFSVGKYRDIILQTNLYKNEDPKLRFIRALSIKHMVSAKYSCGFSNPPLFSIMVAV